ncbi:MAG: pyridoxal phosphate-dependent aminotransferase [Lachnospiraceae bacterium]
MEYIHGGDIYRNDVDIDFSANINPYGMPKEVKNAAIKGIEASIPYPDSEADELCHALARKNGLTKNQVICGNGAADLIYSFVLAKKPKKAVLVTPCFVEYEKALQSVECRCIYHELTYENDFYFSKDKTIGEPFIHLLKKDVDMLFLCNPNNPTGIAISVENLEVILAACIKSEIILVLDECFVDFLEDSNQFTMISYINKCKNLFILKAFTKMYGMAGLRLGYAFCSNPDWVREIKAVRQAWSVSTPAQYAGLAALEEDSFVNKCREKISLERAFLIDGLTQIGMKVFDSQANYIFFYCPYEEISTKLYELCLNEKILIRKCGNYRGLSDSYYRIAVKTRLENEKLLVILKRIISNR